MRFYYIFYIKKEIVNSIKNNPENLYLALENIYMMESNDIILGYKAFDKIANKIEKDNINKLIKEINSDNINYTCYQNIHVINDFFTNESSKLIVNNSHLLLKSNAQYPSFLKDIKSIPNLFVCDFLNMDYFYLKEITSCIESR